MEQRRECTGRYVASRLSPFSFSSSSSSAFSPSASSSISFRPLSTAVMKAHQRRGRSLERAESDIACLPVEYRNTAVSKIQGNAAVPPSRMLFFYEANHLSVEDGG